MRTAALLPLITLLACALLAEVAGAAWPLVPQARRMQTSDSMSATDTITPSPSITKSISVTKSITKTISITRTVSGSVTASHSITPSLSDSASLSATNTPSPASLSSTPSPATLSPTVSDTPTLSLTATVSDSPTISLTASITKTISLTPSNSKSSSFSNSPKTSTATRSQSFSPSLTKTISITPSPTFKCGTGYFIPSQGLCRVAHTLTLQFSLTASPPSSLTAENSTIDAMDILFANVHTTTATATLGNFDLTLVAYTPTATGATLKLTVGPMLSASILLLLNATKTLELPAVGDSLTITALSDGPITSACAAGCQTCNNLLSTGCTSCLAGYTQANSSLANSACTSPAGNVAAAASSGANSAVLMGAIIGSGVAVAVGLVVGYKYYSTRSLKPGGGGGGASPKYDPVLSSTHTLAGGAQAVKTAKGEESGDDVEKGNGKPRRLPRKAPKTVGGGSSTGSDSNGNGDGHNTQPGMDFNAEAGEEEEEAAPVPVPVPVAPVLPPAVMLAHPASAPLKSKRHHKKRTVALPPDLMDDVPVVAPESDTVELDDIMGVTQEPAAV